MRSGTSAKIGSAKKISRRQKFGVLAAAVAGVLALRVASAADYSWDAVGTPGNPPAGGTGIWNTTGLNWTVDNGTNYVAWTNNLLTPDSATFGGTGGTVSLGTQIVVGGLTFNTTGYIIDNGGVGANTISSGLISVTNAGETAAISAGIDSANALTKMGAGTLVLTGVNTYTGDTNVLDGTLAVGAGGNINAAGNLNVLFGAFDVGSNSATANIVAMSSGGSLIGSGTVTANSFHLDDGTASANLAGATADLVKGTSGTLVLSGNNTFGGGLFINGGIVSVSSDTNLGGGNVTMGGGGTLRTTASMSVGATHGFTMAAGGGVFDVATATTTTINGVIDGPQGITKQGAGTLALTASNTYSGATTVIGGTLRLGGDLNTASSVFVSGGSLDVGSANVTTGPVSLFAGSITGTGGSINATSFTANAGSISAILAGSGGLTKNSVSGTVTLTAANQYSGTTLVNLGTLALGAGGSISASSNLTVSGGTFAMGANSTSANAVTLNSGNITGVGGGVLTGSSYTVQSGTISAILAGSGAPLTKNGTGTVTLTAANTYSGSTTVNAGSLVIGVGGNISSSSDLNVNGGTFDIGANSISVGAVTLAGGNINATTGTLTGTVYNVQNGTITANLGNAAASLTKTSGGTVTLKGNNIYGGGTTVSGGRLVSASNNALGSGPITLDGGTLQVGDTPTASGLAGQYWVGGQGGVPNPSNNGGPITAVNPDFFTLGSFNAKYSPFAVLVSAPSTTGGVTQLDWPDTAANPFGNQGVAFGDNIAARWTGKINVTDAGVTQFFTRSDDGSMLFIDGELVVYNNYFQGQTERTGSVDLSAGFHDIALLFYEGGGNAGVTASWVPVGGSKQVIPNSVLFQTPVGTPANAPTSPINVTASSTLDLSLTATGSTQNMGALTRTGSNMLSITGNGRRVNFNGTSLVGASGDNIGFDVYPEVSLGLVSDGANTGLTLTKTGPGSLILDNGGNDLNGTTIDLKAGRLRVQGSGAGVDPLGGASVILDGGTLSLSNPAGGTNFNMPLTLAESSTIERVGNTSDTLSSALTIPSAKNLTVSVLGGSLTRSAGIDGDGGIIKTGPGTLSFDGAAANTYAGGTTVNAGLLQLNKSAGTNAVGNLTVNFGRVGWSASDQINDGAIVNLNGGALNMGANSESFAVLNSIGGTISGNALTVPLINKSLGGTTTIGARLVSPGGTLNVTGGTLRLTNTAIGAGANDVSGVNLNISNGGNLRIERSVGGSNPIGANTIPLNNGTLTIGGQTSYEQGGLSGQFVRIPLNIGADNQLADTASALYSLRGLLAYDSLGNLNNTFNALMSVPYGAGGLSSQVNFTGAINGLGVVGVGGLGSFMTNTPTPLNILQTAVSPGPNNMAVKWAGKINIANAGITSFFSASDDGTMIFIDGQPVVYNNFFQGVVERSGSVNLSAGLHDIVIAYYQGTGGAEASASWQPVGGSKQIIPGSVLFAPTITDANPIIATGISTINVADAAVANVGPLTVNGQLNIVGGAVVPSSTTLDGSNVTILTTGAGLITNNVAETNGPVTVTKIGQGALTLNGASGLTGGINVNGGTVIVNGTSSHSVMNVNALGTLRLVNAAAFNSADINVNNGGIVDVAVANADLSHVKVNAGGKLSLGVAQSNAAGGVAPVSTINGILEVRGFDVGNSFPVQIGAGGGINIFNNGNRIYSSPIDLAGQATINSTGNVTTFNGVISGGGGLTLTSPGTTEVRLENTMTYSGVTNVESGILKARNTNGKLAGTVTINTYAGEIWADDGVINTGGDRIRDDASINMRGGALRHFAGTGSLTNSETVGTVNAIGGVTISEQQTDNTQANTAGTLTILQLNRPVGGRVNFTAVGAGNVLGTVGKIFVNNFSNAGGPAGPIVLNDGIINGSFTVGTDFATYGATGVSALTSFTTAADSVATPWAASNNVKRTITAVETLAASKTINSLTIVNAAAQNFELGTNNLIIDSGGFSQSGGNTLTVNATGGSATTGTLTANGGELFALAVNTIVFNNAIVNNGATPLAFTIGGGGTIRLANINNSFSGGIYLSSSILNTASSTNIGKTIGNNAINFSGNGTLQLKDNSSGNNTTISYGNAVNVFGNGTIDVNNSSANTGSVFVLGNALIDSGRILNVTGANGYRLQLGAVTVNGDSIFNPTTASLTIGALNDQGNLRTLTKTGAADMNLSAAATSWNGTVIINGGALNANAAGALGSAAPRVIVNNGGVFGAGAINQDLSNVTFNNGGGLRLIASMDSSVANTVPTSPITILELGSTNFPATYNNVPLNPAGAIFRQVSTAATTYASSLNLPGPVQFDIPSQNTTITGNLTGVTGSVIKIGGNVLILAPATPNTYAGGTYIQNGTLNANTTGALGTGPVNAISGALNYNAPDAASGQVIFANGAINQSQVGQVNLGTLITSIGSDRFDIAAGNVIGGDPARLGLLSRYGSSSRASNVNLAPGAVVAHTGVGTINDLGTTPDLFFGIATNWTLNNINVGANTPWMGISTDRSGRSMLTGDIIVDDGSNGGTQPATFTSMTLAGLNGQTFTLGSGGTGATPPAVNVNIRRSNPANGKVDVHLVGRVAMNDQSVNFDGVNKFVGDYGSFVMLNAFNTLGTQNVPLEMLAGSVVDIGGGATPAPGALNGNITMRAGSVFRIDDASQFRGTGQIYGKPGSIFMIRGSADDLMNGGTPLVISPQVTGNGVADSEGTLPGMTNAKGAIFRLELDNINQLDAGTSDQGIFSLAGGNRVEGVLTINRDNSASYLNGGMTVYDNNSRSYTATAGLNIGSGGAFFSANGSGSGLFTLTIATTTPINVSAGASLTIGSPKIDFFDKNGHVQFDGPFQGNALASIEKITSGDLVLNNASTGIAGKLVLGDIIGGGSGGNVRFGAGNSNLSDRLLAGTVANNILINDLVKSDININGTPFTTTARGTVNQKFTINGNTNTDGRKLFVNRSTGTVVAGLDLSNVVLNGGGVLTIDESNTDVRANLTLGGDGTISQTAATDPFDLLNVNSDTAGTRRVVTQGRLPDVFGVAAVFGTVGPDVTINQVRGGLRFDPAAGAGQLSAGAIINSLGPDGNGVGSVGSIEVRTGQNGTNPLAGGTINLGSGTPLTVFVDSSAGAPVTNNPNVLVNIGANQSGTLGANRNATGANPGTSLINTVNLGSNGSLSLVAQNTAKVRVGTVNMSGNASISNTSSDTDVSVGDVAAGANTASFDGTRSTQVTGNLTASALAANGFVTFNPGTANTSNVNVSSATVRGAISAGSGVTNFGNVVINGAGPVAGLLESFQSGTGSTFYEGALPAANIHGVKSTLQLYPRRANQARGNTDANFNPATGWVDNSTYIYTGQILIPDNGTPADGQGSIAFGVSFDDSVLVKIDGNQVMRDTTWNNSTSSGQLDYSAGWHNIEIRFGEGSGGVGPDNGVAGWPATFPDNSGFSAIGIQTDPSLGFDSNSGTQGGAAAFATISKYHNPVDDGNMSLFRQAASGDVNVGAGAELRAGGLSGIANARINGAAGNAATLTLVDTGSPVASSVSNLVAGGDGAISFTNNSPIAAANLDVAAGANLSLNGGGTLTVSTGHTLGTGSNVNVNAGKLVINSTASAGDGGINVNASGKLGGSGTILGTVTVNTDGHVAPGNSVGTITFGGLTLNSGGLLDMEGDIGGFDRINVTISNAFNIVGATTINLSDLGGVAAGDYVLIDYDTAFAGNFNDLSLSTATLGGFAASLVNDTGDTSIKLHLAGGTPQWDVDADGSWGTPGNWQGGVPAASGIANFLGKITAPRTVTLDGNRSIADVNFDNANKYTIAQGTGGTLSVSGGISVSAAGSHEISAPVSLAGGNTLNLAGGLTLSGQVSFGAGGTVNKTGAGTLTISGAQAHAVGAALNVKNGAVNLNSNAGTAGSAAGSNLMLSVTGDGTGSARVNLGADQDLAELAVSVTDANSQTVDLSSPAGAGQFRSISVYSATLTAAKTSLYNAIVNANKDGAADPLDGIIDTGLHSGAKVGLALLGDHVLIRQTRVGDLNLDGQVTISDFIDLASNFNTIGTATWQEGDMNYDHNVTISDFIDLASNFNGNYAGGAGAVSDSDAQALASFASSIGVDPAVVGSAVPEPGTISLLAIGAMGLMSRRRRKA